MTEKGVIKFFQEQSHYLKSVGAFYPPQEMYEILFKMIEELQQYRAIGTVEECLEARERQRGKKPKHQGCYDSNGVWHEWNGINGKPYELCPNCETNLCCEMPYDRKPKYCDKCGQKLDWSE